MRITTSASSVPTVNDIAQNMLHELSPCSKRATPSVPNRLVHSYRHQLRRIRTHKDAAVEASLVPFKYTMFAALGYAFLRAAGIFHDPSGSFLTYAKCGLIGGTMLTIPYLISLLTIAENKTESTSNIIRDQLILIATEMVYSTVAACAGSLALGKPGRHTAQVMAVGAIGPVVCSALLYLLLAIVLALVWAVMAFKTRFTRGDQ
ncbi:hypothetical protein AX17_006618 [Amanita inopinata Kibby_2008]|nr:hypothetical protein AX17_006618 [Amanita inopinata Kibby_2008]